MKCLKDTSNLVVYVYVQLIQFNISHISFHSKNSECIKLNTNKYKIISLSTNKPIPTLPSTNIMKFINS